MLPDAMNIILNALTFLLDLLEQEQNKAKVLGISNIEIRNLIFL
jgi:hypothetical protein